MNIKWKFIPRAYKFLEGSLEFNSYFRIRTSQKREMAKYDGHIPRALLNKIYM